MSITTSPASAARVTALCEPAPPSRRVRHLARETAAVMVFSAASSTAVAAMLLILVSLGR